MCSPIVNLKICGLVFEERGKEGKKEGKKEGSEK